MTQQAQTNPNSDTEGLDPTSLAAIRNLLATEPEVALQPVKERQAAKADAAFAPLRDTDEHMHQTRPARASSTRMRQEPEADQRDLGVGDQSIVARAKARITGYRPTAKHIVLASIGLLIFFRPWLVLGLLFLSGFILTAVFLILGYDGFWRRTMGFARWYARRRPARSAVLHRKLDRFAMRWDAVLDRFPEGSVDGLYLPDFGDLAEAEARHDAALDRRFDSLREKEA